MYPELKGKVAVVTGAGSNIGRAIALAFADAGAIVAAADLDPAAAAETAALAAGRPGKALPYKTDISQKEDVAGLAGGVLSGHGRIDIWVNNAGVSQGGKSFLADIPEEVFDRVIGINLRGTWLCMKEILPHMVERGSGCIVNMASVMGLVAAAGQSVYATSKHGLLGLTKAASLEYGPQGVRINAVCPSRMEGAMGQKALDTASQEQRAAGVRMMNPASGRAGRAEEVAAAVLFLCSDGAANTHGAALTVDGGFLAQ